MDGLLVWQQQHSGSAFTISSGACNLTCILFANNPGELYLSNGSAAQGNGNDQ